MLNIFSKEPQQIIAPTSNIDSLVRKGNDYFSDELIILDEKLTGNLFCAEKVVVENRGVLSGNITAKLCVVNGVVNGDITSLDMLEISATATVRGNIQSATVNIEPGAIINGHIIVGEDIEALNRQWNKTKLSTEGHLSAKLVDELSEVNSESVTANDSMIQPEVDQTEPVITEIKVQKPVAVPSPQSGENNQRWW